MCLIRSVFYYFVFTKTHEVSLEKHFKVTLMALFLRKKASASITHTSLHYQNHVASSSSALPPSTLKLKSWTAADAKQQITRGLLTPCRASLRSAQLQSLHLNH
ncbi:hypothetical protein ILYODFUR_018507 [Ilyodon furcidens]|uniref:Uncharacterized protein n=1 Tax=Ilyodon furcidens TaxID=33524 RepID=A0ABV0TZE4_9TELE